MMLKKIAILALVLVSFVSMGLFAQDDEQELEYEYNEVDPATINPDTAQQKLQEISVSKFEDAGFWYGYISNDFGLIFTKAFAGGPSDREALPEEVEAGIVEVDGEGQIVRGDNSVLGVKVSFYRRGVVDFMVRPVRPIPIPGKVKTISVWVAGRDSQHELEVVVADYYGNFAYISMGKLDFPGWHHLTVAVPRSLRQRDAHYSHLGGLTVRGFRVNCDLEETYGNFYVYFDSMTAVTDLFDEELKSEDDILDAW